MVDQLGHGADEEGAEDGAEDRAHAAHDDDGDVLDGEEQVPAVGLHELLVGAEQGAGHGGQRARHHEGPDLGAGETDADHLGGHVAVAHRLHVAAGARANEVLRQQRHQRHQPPHEKEESLVARVDLVAELELGEVDGTELHGHRDVRAAGAAGHGHPVLEDVQAEEHESCSSSLPAPRRCTPRAIIAALIV